MATATLELVIPYPKYGFKRRPPYNEIIGLINEKETITAQLPDRTATLYKASPEGSFFDGTDAVELVQEQQNRITQRQLQELLIKQNTALNGLANHLERHRQQSSSSSSSSTPVSIGEDSGRLSVGLQADLQRRQRQMRDRQQQTGEAHGQALSSQARLPTLEGFFQGATTPIRRTITPLPIPSRQPETIDLTRDEVEDAQEQYLPEKMTARSIENSLRFHNPNATDGAIKRVSNVLLKKVEFFLTPEQIAIDFNNFNILNEIYGALNRNGFISDDDMDEY